MIGLLVKPMSGLWMVVPPKEIDLGATDPHDYPLQYEKGLIHYMKEHWSAFRDWIRNGKSHD
jgi:hypothetical protein